MASSQTVEVVGLCQAVAFFLAWLNSNYHALKVAEYSVLLPLCFLAAH